MAIPVLQVGHWMTLCVSPKEKKKKVISPLHKQAPQDAVEEF